MKYFCIGLIVLLYPAASRLLAQSAESYISAGIAKAREEDFVTALRDFMRATEIAPKNPETWYMKAMCHTSLHQEDSALYNLDMAIRVDSNFAKAYVGRAEVYARASQFDLALSEVQIALKKDTADTYALCTRGQLFSLKGDKLHACEDFRKAVALGDPQAVHYAEQYCGMEQPTGESLMLYWPESENWKVVARQNEGNVMLLELAHANESLESWTELGHMMTISQTTNTNLDSVMKSIYAGALEQSPKATLSVVERNSKDPCPWVIFCIEGSSFGYDHSSESQMWLVRQGNEHLYLCFRAIKSTALPDELKNKWREFFKGSKVQVK